MKYLFFCLEPQIENLSGPDLDADYSWKLWRPSLSSIVPPGLPLLPFAAWWIMHYLHIFANRDYGILLIYADGKLVHRSCMFPGYFRFPFMGQYDLQIGDTWTDPRYRGRGLAKYALQRAVKLFQKPGRKFWYLVEQDNPASIRVVEKAGFAKIGEGMRIKRFGLRVLGAYIFQQPATSHK